MNTYQRTFAKLAPELNPIHCESLAIGAFSTLNGLPIKAFEELVSIAREMGPQRLAEFHDGMCP